MAFFGEHNFWRAGRKRASNAFLLFFKAGCAQIYVTTCYFSKQSSLAHREREITPSPSEAIEPLFGLSKRAIAVVILYEQQPPPAAATNMNTAYEQESVITSRIQNTAYRTRASSHLESHLDSRHILESSPLPMHAATPPRADALPYSHIRIASIADARYFPARR